jgi:histidyl-tRNA synthetase
MTEIQGLPGFRDFYPEDLAVRAYLMGIWRDVARRYAFEEYDGPPLEELELYRRKSGDEIVQQLYEFEDKGGRHVALRPEMTPTLARMVGARARALRKPVRWYSIPQLFRYERKQRGRTREHFQLNMDIIGEPDVLADAELLAAAVDVCRTAGLDAGQVRARVSDRRVLAAVLSHRGVPAASLEAVYGVIDKLDRERRERLEEKLADLGLPSDAVAAVFETTQTRGIEELKSRYGKVPAVAETIAELDRYLEHLDDLGVAEFVDVDLSVVRGLAYYTGIVFELWDARRELRAICGGGRYDDLLELLGGIDMPALGFGMGDVVLGELLVDHDLLPDQTASVDCFVAYIGPEARRRALQVTRRLRGAGFSTVYDFRERRLGNQLKSANQSGARVAVILGPQEVEAGQARLRTMSSGEERVVAIDEVVEALRQDGETDG